MVGQVHCDAHDPVKRNTHVHPANLEMSLVPDGIDKLQISAKKCGNTFNHCHLHIAVLVFEKLNQNKYNFY